MKRNATIRIIVYSLVIVILLGILLTGLGVGMFTTRVRSQIEVYTHGGGEIPAREIRQIEIEWASGKIQIQAAPADTITFQEIGDGDNDPMVYRQSGDKLSIQYQTPGVHFGFSSSGSKELIITVPQDWYCHDLTVEAASADVFINSLTAGEVELNMASGESHITDCEFVDLDVECASGEVYFSGALTNMDCNSASGKVTAVFENIPASIDFDGASADLELTLPEDAGFTVEMDALSGSFQTDFETAQRNGQHICGDGACRIDVDGMSGSVTIRKNENKIPNTR